jgi:hypothetical protein
MSPLMDYQPTDLLIHIIFIDPWHSSPTGHPPTFEMLEFSSSKELGFDIEDSHMGGRELRFSGQKVGVQLAKSLILLLLELVKVLLVCLLWSLKTFEDDVALGLVLSWLFQFSFVHFFQKVAFCNLSVFSWTTSSSLFLSSLCNISCLDLA